MIESQVSFLVYYLKFFGDTRYRFVDLTPGYDTVARTPHMTLDQKFSDPAIQELTEEEAIAKMDEYSHPCWCNPELIYADDKRGNEVWLHKPTQ